MKKEKIKDGILRKVMGFARPIAHWIVLSAMISMAAIGCDVLSPTILGDLVQMLYDYWESGCAGTVTDKLAGACGCCSACMPAGVRWNGRT